MRPARVLSGVLLAGCVSLVGWLATRTSLGDGDDGEPMRVQVLEPSHSLEYALGDGGQVEVLVQAVLPDLSVGQVTRTEDLDLRWLDGGGQEVGSQRTRLRLEGRGGRLRHDGSVVSEARVVRAEMGLGRRLLLSIADPGAGAPLHVLVRRRGTPGRPWRVLAPNGHAHGDVVMPVEGEGRLALAPGRRLSVNVVGPATLRLAGSKGIEGLRLEAVLADPETGGGGMLPGGVWEVPSGSDVAVTGPSRVDLPLHPSAAVGLPGEEATVQVSLSQARPASVWITNPTDQDVGPFYVALEGPGHPWGQVSAFGGQRLLVPEWQDTQAWRVGPSDPAPLQYVVPAPGRGGILRVEVRGIGVDRSAPGSFMVSVRGYTGSGKEAWTRSLAVDLEPAPSEVLATDGLPGQPVSTEDPWLSEPRTMHLLYESFVARIQVLADAPAAVRVLASGGLEGFDDLYLPPQVLSSVRLRHGAQAPTRWHPVLPADLPGLVDGGRQARIRGNVRLEPVAVPTAGTASERVFSTITPVGGPPPRVWMVPAGENARAGRWYCRYLPSDAEQPLDFSGEARDRLGGLLQGYVLASGPGQVGTPYKIELDGLPWQQGRLVRGSAPVGGKQPPRSRLRLSAWPGVSLWLRTWGVPGSNCEDPRKTANAWLVPAGGVVRYLHEKKLDNEILMVGGFGAADAQVRVLVDGGRPSRAPSLLPDLTPAERELELPVSPHVAMLVDKPTFTLPVLWGEAVALGADLAQGKHEILVVNESLFPFFLRVAVEGRGWGDFTEYPASALLRAGGEAP